MGLVTSFKKKGFCNSIGFQLQLFLIIIHIFKLFFNSSFPLSVGVPSGLWPVLSFPFHLCLSVSYMWLLNCRGPSIFSSLRCSIDCAGILKLRNSDIELRKGETDIGRKNTRVRVVFRVHIPQPNGKVLSLQAASIPVECCECLTHAHKHMHSHILTTKYTCTLQLAYLYSLNFFLLRILRTMWIFCCGCQTGLDFLIYFSFATGKVYLMCLIFLPLVVYNSDCNQL